MKEKCNFISVSQIICWWWAWMFR